MDEELVQQWMLHDFMRREQEEFHENVLRAANNDPTLTEMTFGHFGHHIYFLGEESFFHIGRIIALNTHIDKLWLAGINLGDGNTSALFRGLTRSASIKTAFLSDNRIVASGIRSMVPFLQSANNLTKLVLNSNNIALESWRVLWGALRDSPIETLWCCRCGLDTIEIDSENVPVNLTDLSLGRNNISSDGCRELAKLLQEGDSTLEILCLNENKIDDEGVAILVNALQSNTTLETLKIDDNDEITMEGKVLLLKLVIDVSSIRATLQSNHTLHDVKVDKDTEDIQLYIDEALAINQMYEDNPSGAGRGKMIGMQLNSMTRADLANIQGVGRSLYSEINPLHLPEVLALVGESYDHEELYLAFLSSISLLHSTVDRMKCLKQQRDYHASIVSKHEAIVAEHRAKLVQLDDELTTMEEAGQGDEGNNEIEHRSNKRRRK